MRTLAVLGALAVLSSCSDEGANPILARGMEAVTSRVRASPAPGASAEGPAQPSVLTREDIEATGVAAIRLRLLEGSETGAIFYGAVENNGVVSFVTPMRETVGLRGSQVVSTRGLGTDLLRGWSSSEDPLATPTPPGEWPQTVTRAYEFPGIGARGEIREYLCTFDMGEVRTISILRQEHQGVEITETCRGSNGSFENLHFADIKSGFVWRSLQWTGPEQGLVDFEVIVPVT